MRGFSLIDHTLLTPSLHKQWLYVAENHLSAKQAVTISVFLRLIIKLQFLNSSLKKNHQKPQSDSQTSTDKESTSQNLHI